MTNENGSGNVEKMSDPFVIERSLIGVAHGFTEIAERVVNHTLEPKEAREATMALNGVTNVTKVQLAAIKVFEQASQRAKEEAARILGIAAPALTDQTSK
ncbi:MAG TPA: hypothetical protein VH187_05455 [Scandinavium sp.]|jgi:hypothetical protein|uniref:hypothetical protein n=1 Tax=Scandinavium sp. TaxID=2830653 RepID=UPI002E2F0868|nr:hypothetical protein [Scandinavium sp.]HEX4500607.1 hypothetical protein [Scandinavium sp.]